MVWREEGEKGAERRADIAAQEGAEGQGKWYHWINLYSLKVESKDLL